MAKRKTAKAASPRQAPPPADPVDAALRLAMVQGWDHTSLSDIARESGVPLAELYQRYPSKLAILDAFMQRIDEAMLRPEPDEAEEPPRDRVFAAIMRRLDALTPHKAALRSIQRAAMRDPVLALCGAAGPFRRTLTWMLEGAGYDSSGLRGWLRRQALGAVYADTLRTWLDDDSADQSKTMAKLDRRLRQALRLSRLFGGREPPPATA